MQQQELVIIQKNNLVCILIRLRRCPRANRCALFSFSWAPSGALVLSLTSKLWILLEVNDVMLLFSEGNNGRSMSISTTGESKKVTQ